MSCSDARERMELAALEPGGLDRLMAGDTTEAAALAGHLAGCPDCTAELGSLRRTVAALELARPEPAVTAATGDAARPAPSDLRKRTLAYVAAFGRPRPRATTPAAEPRAREGAPAGPAHPEPTRGPAAWFQRRGAGIAAIAAAIAFALLAAGSFVAADLQGQLEASRAETERLRELSTELSAVLQEPGSQLVSLASGDGTAGGALALARSSEQLVVVTRALPAPPAGMEYRCWVEVDGQRRAVGTMSFGGGLAYWAGWVGGLASLPPGATFGVSLEPIGGPGGAQAVLLGTL